MSLTLTSPAGRFTFPSGTRLSCAKLVRDTVTAGSRGAIPHTPRPTPQNAKAWFNRHAKGPVADEILDFEWDNTMAWSN